MLTALVVVVVVLLLGSLCVGWLISIVQRSRHTKASWVVRYLQRQGTYAVKAGPFTSVWTPERPSSDLRLPMGFYQMPGRGSLTYSLDPDGETVRLVWRTQGGSQREWVGPVPFVATVDYRSSMHRGRATALVVVAALAVGGAVLGAITNSSLAGLAGGLVAGLFVGSTVLSGKQMQAFSTGYDLRRKKAGSAANQATSGDESAGTSPGLVKGHPSSKQRRTMRAVYVIYGTVLTLGFVLGFVLVSGSGVKRFLFGVLGLLLAITFVFIVSGLIRVGVALKTPKHPGTDKAPLS